MLDLFCWGLDKLSRPTLRNLLGDYDHDEERVRDPYFWRRLEQQKWVTRTGQGAEAVFAITATGRQVCAEIDPAPRWDLPWDKRWRLVTFDVPESRRADRITLWRELHNRNLGLLQRSVWISPHDIEPLLRDVIQANGIPECFAGFECSRLFLCSNREIVQTAWDFEAIVRVQESYRKAINSFQGRIQDATNLNALARVAREERLAYTAAMSDDPFLPKELWPEGYRGRELRERHLTVRSLLSLSFQRMLKKQA